LKFWIFRVGFCMWYSHTNTVTTPPQWSEGWLSIFTSFSITIECWSSRNKILAARLEGRYEYKRDSSDYSRRRWWSGNQRNNKVQWSTRTLIHFMRFILLEECWWSDFMCSVQNFANNLPLLKFHCEQCLHLLVLYSCQNYNFSVLLWNCSQINPHASMLSRVGGKRDENNEF
jgi:hypothetical protein